MRATENLVSDSSITSEQYDKDMSGQSYRFWLFLSLIVIVSFAVRVAALAYWETGAIESEGAEYARIAENLRHRVRWACDARSPAKLSSPFSLAYCRSLFYNSQL